MLLDTHTWIWYANGDPILKPSIVAAIEQAGRSNQLFLCPISLWEITLKVSQGKMHFDSPVRLWLERAFDSTSIRLTDLNIDVACECAALPADFHGDPGDRLIAATAISEGLTLATHDGIMLKLARKGYLKVIAT